MSQEQTNALGEPSPRRTDFSAWERKTLEAFARDAADENLVLRADIKALHEYIRNEWRKEL